MNTDVTSRISICDDTTNIITLERGRRECFVIQGARYTVQMTSYGDAAAETWDIEVVDCQSQWDTNWRLVATAYGRDQMWIIVDAYLNRL